MISKASSQLQLAHASFRIIGLGVAGSLLAWRMVKSGLNVRVSHTGMPGQASCVAPGLVNPLASRKLEMNPLFPTLKTVADQTYDEWQRDFGAMIQHKIPIIRLLRTGVQAAAIGAMEAPHSADVRGPYIAGIHSKGRWPFLRGDTFGSIETIGGGWVDLPLLCRRTEDWLRDKQLLDEHEWNPAENDEADVVIHCGGWRAGESDLWQWLPHNPAKGELIWIRPSRSLPEDRILHGGTWMQPMGDGVWRAGARYSWNEFDSGPSAVGIDALKRQIREWLNLEFEVLDQCAGVRPILRDYKPVVGQHPRNPRHWILNGLGSKGAIQAPWLVDRLLRHWIEADPLPFEVNITRFGE